MADDSSNRLSFSRGRKWSIAFNVVLRSAIVLAVVGMIVYLGGRHFQRWYLSSKTRVELSPRTVNVLKSLTNDVNVILYYDKEEPLYSTILALLDEYQDINPRLKVRTVDYIRDAAEAQLVKNKFDLSSTPDRREKDVVIFDRGNGNFKVADSKAIAQYAYEETFTETGEREYDRKLVSFNGEMMFTSMLLAVNSPAPFLACYVIGHGEHAIDSADEVSGYMKFYTALQQNYVQVQQVSLLTNQLPQECDLLVIAGPRNDFLEPELAKIQSYLDKGGRLFVLLNSFSEKGLPELEKALGRWGVVVGDRAVKESIEGSTISGSDVIVMAFGRHPVVNSLVGTRLHLLMPRWINAKEFSNAPADAPKAEAIAFSSEQAELADTPTLPAQRYPLMVAVEKGSVSGVVTEHGATRILVVGDSYFLGNRLIASAANESFVWFAVNWLLERPYLLEGLGPRPVAEFRLNMTNAELRTVQWILLVAMPGAFLLVGGVVWIRRRK